MANIPNQIDDYKKRLGLGARANLFSVDLTFPALVGADQDLENDFKIMCIQAGWPALRPVTPIPVSYQGEFFKLPGDKADFADVTFMFNNSEDYRLRNIFDTWVQLVNQDRAGVRNNPEDLVTSIFISQLDHARNEIKKVELIGAWPNSAAAENAFDRSADGTISQTSVIISYDWARDVAIV